MFLLTVFSQNYENFLNSLTVMWKGMLGIFVVLGVLLVFVAIMTKLTSKDKNKKETE